MNAVAESFAGATRIVPLNEVVEINPRFDRNALSDDLEVSFVAMASVETGTGRLDATTVRRFGEVKKGYTIFHEGDVLFAKITPCMENGKMAVARDLRNGIGCGSTEFHVLRPKPGVDANYVYHFVSSARFRREAAHHMTGAVGQKRVPAAFLEDCKIPLPNLGDQRRIVAELEKQISRLDEAVASLGKVKAGIKRYRTAVLKAAVEGQLVPTEAELARREGRKFETAEELRARALQQRRSAWSGRGKCREPIGANPRLLNALPEGWVWTTVDEVTSLVTSGSRGWGEFYSDQGVLFIRAQDIKTDAVVFADVARVNVPAGAEGTRAFVGAGDVLVTITGANVTKSALVSTLDELAFVSQHVALLKFALHDLSPFVFSWIVSPANGRKTLEKWAYGAGKPGLSLEQMRALPIALPPLNEQRRIVAEVDRRLSIVREFETEIDANHERAQALLQAVLRHAFTARR